MSRSNPEMRLHMAILAYLQAVLPREAAETLSHVPNGENRSAITGAKLKRMGARPGVEDLQFIHAGRLHAVEVKPEGAYQSPSQKARQAALIAAGAVYQVCRSLDDVTDTLLAWGIPTRELRACPLDAAEKAMADG